MTSPTAGKEVGFDGRDHGVERLQAPVGGRRRVRLDEAVRVDIQHVGLHELVLAEDRQPRHAVGRGARDRRGVGRRPDRDLPGDLGARPVEEVGEVVERDAVRRRVDHGRGELRADEHEHLQLGPGRPLDDAVRQHHEHHTLDRRRGAHRPPLHISGAGPTRTPAHSCSSRPVPSGRSRPAGASRRRPRRRRAACGRAAPVGTEPPPIVRVQVAVTVLLKNSTWMCTVIDAVP